MPLRPTDAQLTAMDELRVAARVYAEVLDKHLPEGPDKTYAIRMHREVAMWVNVACMPPAGRGAQAGPGRRRAGAAGEEERMMPKSKPLNAEHTYQVVGNLTLDEGTKLVVIDIVDKDKMHSLVLAKPEMLEQIKRAGDATFEQHKAFKP